MVSQAPLRGVFAIDWADVELDGVRGPAPAWLRVGAVWVLRGAALRLDGAPSVLRLPEPAHAPALNTRARAIAERLSGLTVPSVLDLHEAPSAGLTLTDGTHIYIARLVELAGRALVAFEGSIPAQGQECWVASYNPPPTPGLHTRDQEVICFASDTLIATPEGARPISTLRPGCKVTTRDNGTQPVLWVGETRLSGLALRQHPHLRPIRFRRGALREGLPHEDLCVSPGHRMLIKGTKARALFGSDEVLARAADLVDFRAIAPDIALHGVTYVHLLLEHHQILYANGMPTESFHPALAPRTTLRHHRGTLSTLAPDWLDQPERYGPTARRILNTGEAALLAA